MCTRRSVGSWPASTTRERDIVDASGETILAQSRSIPGLWRRGSLLLSAWVCASAGVLSAPRGAKAERAGAGPPATAPAQAAPTATLAASAAPSTAVHYRIADDVLQVLAGVAGDRVVLGSVKLPAPAVGISHAASLLVARLSPRGFVLIDVSSSAGPRIIYQDLQTALAAAELADGFLHQRFADGRAVHQSVALLTGAAGAARPQSGSSSPPPAVASGKDDGSGRPAPAPTGGGCGAGDPVPPDAIRFAVASGALLVQDARNGCDLGSLQLPGPHRILSRFQTLAFVALEPRGLLVIDASTPSRPQVVRHRPRLEIVEQRVVGEKLELRLLDGERLSESLPALLRAIADSTTPAIASGDRARLGPVSGSASPAGAEEPRSVSGNRLPRCPPSSPPPPPHELSLVSDQGLVVLNKERSCWYGSLPLSKAIIDVVRDRELAYIATEDGRVASVSLRQVRVPQLVSMQSTGCSPRRGMRIEEQQRVLAVPTNEGATAMFTLLLDGGLRALATDQASMCRRAAGMNAGEDGERIPSPAESSSSPGTIPLIMGLAGLPMVYLLTVVPTILADAAVCKSQDVNCQHGTFYIPIVGPWIDLGTHNWSGGSAALPVASGLLQATAVTLWITGVIRRQLALPTGRQAWRVTPGVGGLAISGQF